MTSHTHGSSSTLHSQGGVKYVQPQGNRFCETIEESNLVLQKARRGLSVINEPVMQESISLKSLTLFEKDDLKKDLAHFLDLAAAKCRFHNQMPPIERA